MKKWIYLAALGVIVKGFAPCAIAGNNGQQEWIITKNPYEDVNWETYGQYLGSLHNHTTESDGAHDPAQVIDDYRDSGYDIVAITDHNHVTWPWQAYGRDPDVLSMVAVESNELSRHHHANSHFTRYPQPFREASTDDLETSLAEQEELGGVAHLNHPGRYWSLNDQGEVPEEVLERYIALFEEYPSLVGMEIHNQDDRYPHDRRLWDALLTEFMPRRAIWGFANDDSHHVSHVGLNATVFLLPELDKNCVRLALMGGRFYSTTVTTHPEQERDRSKIPEISKIAYYPGTATVVVEAECDGRSVEREDYTWVSAGGETVQAEGTKLGLNETDGLGKYLRVEIRGEGGTAYTQPLGIRPRPE